AGVIHRDFKPDNVIVGRDGRIRVADFGLARNAGDAPTPGVAGDARADAKLTQTGALIGTPRFMAPEQFTGAAITPATDQFAFCVALFTALYGTQPFRGDRVTEIAAHVVAGEITRPLAPRGPSALRRSIVRGLAGNPVDRHPSMDALVQQLERARTLRRKRALVAGAIAAVATTVLVVELARSGDDVPCATSAAKMTTAWNPTRAAAVRAALASAPTVVGSVEKRLTSYANAWSAASTAACKATHVDEEQSPAMLDLRVACLDERLAALNVIVTELEHADRETSGRAIEAADALPSLAVCADRKALAERVAPPDQAIASRVAQIATQLARATTLQRLGKVAPALEIANAACAAVDALRYAPVTARCRYVVASLADESAGDRARAIDLMAESVNAATAGNDQERVAEAALALARLLGDRVERYDEANRWLELAEGARARLVERNDIAARIASVRGVMAARRARHEDALAQFEQVLRLADDRRGLPAARAHVSIGHSLLALERADDAEPHYRAALAITEELAGGQHPELLPVLDGLGNLSFARGDASGAVPYLERSLAITRTMVDRSHPAAITAQANLGAALTNAKQLDRALAELEEARLAVKPSDRRELAMVLTNLVPVYQQRGDSERALATARDALAVEREVKGEDHPETGIAYFNVGDTLLASKRPREAAEAVGRALSIWERT
ncbi:MAG: tetratricopeptide repeat protein, partial [Deltaproteobacteria bacterium]|nr:tetratricopeptide repeat protein [Deltaproteobacteria bacterium]